MSAEDRSATFDILQWVDVSARAAYAAAVRSLPYGAGQMIYLQGEPGEEMYRIAAGSVRLSVLGADGRDVTYVRLGPGDCFGDVSLIDGGIRPQTAVAVSDCRVEVLERAAFLRLRAQHRCFDEAMLQLLSRQMRTASNLFLDLSLNELSGRVARRLLHEAQGQQDARTAGPGIRLSLAQSEIASMVSASRQTVNRVLQAMQRDGIIATEYNAIIVTNLERLRSMALHDSSTIVAGATELGTDRV